MRYLGVVALLLGIGSAGAQQNFSTVEALRMKILSNMNPMVPPSTGPGPWAEGWGEGNQVKVQFRVFKVLEVDIPSRQAPLQGLAAHALVRQSTEVESCARVWPCPRRS